MMITLLVKLTAKPDKRDELEQALVSLARESREEPGCEIFIASREVHGPGQFVLFEQWRDSASLSAHNEGAAVRRMRSVLPELIEGDPEVCALEALFHAIAHHE